MSTVTLRDVLAAPQAGFRLMMAYSLRLETSLMGYFPAIFDDEQLSAQFGEKDPRIVVVVDKELLKKVLGLLEMREFEVDQSLCYVNAEGTAGFMLTSGGNPLENIVSWDAFPILTAQELEQCTANGVIPFRWGAGLHGDPRLSEQEFARMVEQRFKKLL